MNAMTYTDTNDYSLDCDNELLLHGRQEIQLRPKLFALLAYMIKHPNRLLTREELLTQVWPDVYVSSDIIKTYVRDLRKLLGDDPHHPSFIETKHGRGYRFIGHIGLKTLQQESPLRAGVGTRYHF
ncbi:MAG: winged helix-turn-helix domain-containing protein [Candidatus Competibacteraceae bacterium]|nr:winged helix-turn-helix domain-containing protein [Candidatus Competibacteraceae bacterium]